MKWFKHDSNASMDAKLKRIRAKYGMEGYGLYWFCLELVAQNVDKHNLTFELEHDAELISIDTGIHYEIVQEIMQEFVKLGLFENTGGLITCLKMATRTDEYTQQVMRSKENIGTLSRHSPDKLPGIRREENRIEEKKNSRFTPPSLDDIKRYCQKRKNQIDPESFLNFYESKNWMIGKTKMANWEAAIRTWEIKSKSENNSQDEQTKFAI